MPVRQNVEPVGLQGLVPRPVSPPEQNQNPGTGIILRRNPAEKTDAVDPEVLRLNTPAEEKKNCQPEFHSTVLPETAWGCSPHSPARVGTP